MYIFIFTAQIAMMFTVRQHLTELWLLATQNCKTMGFFSLGITLNHICSNSWQTLIKICRAVCVHRDKKKWPQHPRVIENLIENYLTGSRCLQWLCDYFEGEKKLTCMLNLATQKKKLCDLRKNKQTTHKCLETLLNLHHKCCQSRVINYLNLKGISWQVVIRFF